MVVDVFKATSIAAGPNIMSLWFHKDLTLKQPINIDILIYKCGFFNMIILNYYPIRAMNLTTLLANDPFHPYYISDKVYIEIKNIPKGKNSGI